jgi:hypothetical protein
MKTVYIFFISILILIFTSCNSENRSNSRVYVEGIISGSDLDFSKIKVQLKSENKIIAETFPTNSGAFVLSGMLLSDQFSLVLNKKINSFSASKTGGIISSNELEILLPSGTSYVIFKEIKVE